MTLTERAGVLLWYLTELLKWCHDTLSESYEVPAGWSAPKVCAP